jgi:WD40 repeat protein
VRPLAVLLLTTLLLPTAGAFHVSPTATEEMTRWSTGDPVTWRSTAYHPDGHAVVVGAYEDPHTDETYSLIAEWSAEDGLMEVYNRSGPPLVDVDIREDGTHLVVGLRDTILLGEPGSFTNVWEESEYAADDRDLTFYGLGAAFAPDEGFGLASGSSLLRVNDDGSLDVVHSGEGAFFRSIDFNPASDYALVEAAVEQEDRAILGTVWRTDGYTNMTQDDNVAVYGRFEQGDALLNAISFAPNGTFATFAGRDGAGASFLTWSPDRSVCHSHADRDGCHDHSYRYMGAEKPTGPVTCIDWHPSGEYALVTGLEQDQIGYADTRMWAPLAHDGPGLLGCAFGPEGEEALAVGENGTLVRIDPGEGPLVRVLDPKPGRLAPPETEQTFLVGVLDRSETPTTDVTGRIEGNDTVQEARYEAPWWELSVNASHLEDGRHRLIVSANGTAGHARLSFPFLVNNEAFQPSTPTIEQPEGLESKNRDSDGLFTIRWETLDEPVVYQIEQQRRGETANATKVLDAGSDGNETVRVHQDGTYFFRVRAANSHAAGNWSQRVSVEVVLDSDGDGVPDARDPQPHTANQWGDPDGDGVPTDKELKQCSDPYDESSTPTSDDDGDGIPNGIECEQGTDPRDPNDPPPDNASTDDGGDPNTSADDRAGGSDEIPAPGLLALVASALAAGLTRRRV